MSKLLALRKWLTLEEAARHISTTLGEPLDAAGLLQHALDGQIDLCIRLANPKNLRAGVCARSDDPRLRDLLQAPHSMRGVGENLVIFPSEPRNLRTACTGYFDLRTSDARLFIQRHIDKMNGSARSLPSPLAKCLLWSSDGTPYKIEAEHDLAEHLYASEFTFGVRTAALDAFLASLGVVQPAAPPASQPATGATARAEAEAEPAPGPAPDVATRAELIARLERYWPSIENDLKKTGTPDSLSVARIGYGKYAVQPAIEWAIRNGRWKGPPA